MLVELVSGTIVILLGVMAIAAVLVSTTRQNAEIAAQNQVLLRAQSVMETIKAANPEDLATYDGNEYAVENVSGNFSAGATIQVGVDTANPRLIGVTLNASWDVEGRTHATQFWTEIFNPKG